MNKGNLIGGRELLEMFQTNPRHAALIQRMITAITTLGNNLAASPTGKTAPPPPVGSVAVKVSGEYAHVQIQDYAPVQKGVHYFTEVATDPSFTQPIVIHHGASRCSHPFPLPANNDGATKQTYYFRSYSQYPGSDPSEPVLYGGTAPIGVQMTGATNMTLLQSTGSGTAAGTGGQGGSGFGKVQVRSAPGPKRSVL